MPKFEDQLKQLEQIVQQLEQNELPLEDSLRLFEEGMQLSRHCKAKLNAAEGRMQILLEKRDGSREPEDLDLEK